VKHVINELDVCFIVAVDSSNKARITAVFALMLTYFQQDYWTALMKASERGHSECARIILSHPSANPNKHDKV